MASDDGSATSSWNMNSVWYSLRNWAERASSRNREYTRLMSSTFTSVPYEEIITLLKLKKRLDMKKRVCFIGSAMFVCRLVILIKKIHKACKEGQPLIILLNKIEKCKKHLSPSSAFYIFSSSLMYFCLTTTTTTSCMVWPSPPRTRPYLSLPAH